MYLHKDIYIYIFMCVCVELATFPSSRQNGKEKIGKEERTILKIHL